MPRRYKRATETCSFSRTSSPKKKPSPIKPLVLRRTSQTPERILYEIVPRNSCIKTATFLEESYDETSPSPPPLLIEQKEETKFHTVQNECQKASRKKSFNTFGLEESADDESEEENNLKVVQKSKKKKKISKRSKKSKATESMKNCRDIFADANMSAVLEGPQILQDITAMVDQTLTPFNKTKSDGTNDDRTEKVSNSSLATTLKIQSIMEVEKDEEMLVDQGTVSLHGENVEKISKRKSKRTSISELFIDSPSCSPIAVPKTSPFESPPVSSKFQSSSKKSEISEDSFEFIIEESAAVKPTVVEKLKNLKIKDNIQIFNEESRDTVLKETIMNMDVANAKSKPKRKLSSKKEKENVFSSPKPTQKLSNLASPDIEMENIEPHSTVSFIKHEHFDSTVSFAKQKYPSTVSIIDNKQSEPIASFNEEESSMAATSTITKSKNIREDIPKEYASEESSTFSPFTFTPEQLERLKSQQLPPHVPIPKGSVAVKLVPQNRSCAPVFIQIPQKDFRRMLPKLPQQSQNS